MRACLQALKMAATHSNLGRAGLDEASIQKFARYDAEHARSVGIF
jgi:hypothetical protein